MDKRYTEQDVQILPIPSKRIKDLTGTIFGKGTVIGYAGKSNSGQSLWWVKCSCGNYYKPSGSNLLRGSSKSCGCLRRKNVSTSNISCKRKDLTNTKFGKWTVLKYDKTINDKAYWICQCDCGNLKSVSANHLLSGKSCSCGCTKSKGEEKIIDILNNLNIKYETQKIFKNCQFSNTGGFAKFDFYLPEYNLIIEYDGEQHFQYQNNGWNNKENFEKTQQRDQFKNQWCKENNISLIRIPYTEFEQLDINYFKNLLKLK